MVRRVQVWFAALARLRTSGLYTAEVDLWNYEDSASLTKALAQSIVANRSAVTKALARARESGRELRELIPASVTATLRTHLGENVELAWGGAVEEGAHGSGLGATIALAQRIAEKDDKRIALFLDEFQDIAAPSNRFGDPDFLGKQLRAQLQRAPLVSMLFVGSVEHVMRDLFGQTRGALSQLDAFHALSPILPGEWRAGIVSRYRMLDVETSEQAVTQVVALGDGHPRSTMLIARETLTVALTRREAAAIELGDVQGGYELALQADRLRHDEIIERLRSTAHAYAVALRVARGKHPYAGTSPSGARRALAMLERAGIAEHRGRGEWVIPEPLLRSFLAARP